MRLWIYQIVMTLIRFLVPIIRLIPHEKIRYFATHQGQIRTLQTLSEKPIWIHASSGEIEYAKSLIREIQLSFPNIPILVTHTSISSLKALESLGVQAIGVLPIDDVRSVQNFLNLIQPRICLLARTDLWPQMILELKNRKIPCSLFSATFATGSKKTNWISTIFLNSAIHNLASIYFVNEEDQNYCESLYGKISNGKILGDTRYDQVTYHLNRNSNFSFPTTKKTLLLGSTWEEDEIVWLKIIKQLINDGWKLIWVPHEVADNHINKLMMQIQKQSVSAERYSKFQQTWDWNRFDVLLVDQVGLLAKLYPLSQLAFVGGSFKKQVHSVMEPLAAGCPVLVGPYHHNNREALEFKQKGFVFEISNSNHAYQLCQKIQLQSESLKVEILNQIRVKTGATQKLLNELKSIGVFDAHPLERIK